MENERLLKLLEDCTMTDEDAVGMIFSNFIDIGGTLVGLTVENAIKAGALLREYDKRRLLKSSPGRRTTASTGQHTSDSDSERAAIIIKKAKEKYPASYSFTGSLTEDQAEEIEKECDIRTSSVYMNGTSCYFIRYRNEVRTY